MIPSIACGNPFSSPVSCSSCTSGCLMRTGVLLRAGPVFFRIAYSQFPFRQVHLLLTREGRGYSGSGIFSGFSRSSSPHFVHSCFMFRFLLRSDSSRFFLRVQEFPVILIIPAQQLRCRELIRTLLRALTAVPASFNLLHLILPVLRKPAR